MVRLMPSQRSGTSWASQRRVDHIEGTSLGLLHAMQKTVTAGRRPQADPEFLDIFVESQFHFGERRFAIFHLKKCAQKNWHRNICQPVKHALSRRNTFVSPLAQIMPQTILPQKNIDPPHLHKTTWTAWLDPQPTPTQKQLKPKKLQEKINKKRLKNIHMHVGTETFQHVDLGKHGICFPTLSAFPATYFQSGNPMSCKTRG